MDHSSNGKTSGCSCYTCCSFLDPRSRWSAQSEEGNRSAKYIGSGIEQTSELVQTADPCSQPRSGYGIDGTAPAVVKRCCSHHFADRRSAPSPGPLNSAANPWLLGRLPSAYYQVKIRLLRHTYTAGRQGPVPTHCPDRMRVFGNPLRRPDRPAFAGCSPGQT